MPTDTKNKTYSKKSLLNSLKLISNQPSENINTTDFKRIYDTLLYFFEQKDFQAIEDSVYFFEVILTKNLNTIYDLKSEKGNFFYLLHIGIFYQQDLSEDLLGKFILCFGYKYPLISKLDKELSEDFKNILSFTPTKFLIENLINYKSIRFNKNFYNKQAIGILNIIILLKQLLNKEDTEIDNPFVEHLGNNFLKEMVADLKILTSEELLSCLVASKIFNFDLPQHILENRISITSPRVCNLKWKMLIEKKIFSKSFYFEFLYLNDDNLVEILTNESFAGEIDAEKLKISKKAVIEKIIEKNKETANKYLISYINNKNLKESEFYNFIYCDTANFSDLNEKCDFRLLNRFLKKFFRKEKNIENLFENLTEEQIIIRHSILNLKMNSTNISLDTVKENIADCLEVFDKKYFEENVLNLVNYTQIFKKYPEIYSSETFNKQNSESKLKNLELLTPEMLETLVEEFLSSNSKKTFFDNSEERSYSGNLNICYLFSLYLNDKSFKTPENVDYSFLMANFYKHIDFILSFEIGAPNFLYKIIGELKINLASNFYDEDFYYLLNSSYTETTTDNHLLPFDDRTYEILCSCLEICLKYNFECLIFILKNILNIENEKKEIKILSNSEIEDLKENSLFYYKIFYDSNTTKNIDKQILLTEKEFPFLEIEEYEKIKNIINKNKTVEETIKFIEIELNLENETEALCYFVCSVLKIFKQSEKRSTKEVLEEFSKLNLKLEKIPLTDNPKIQNLLIKRVYSSNQLDNFNPNFISNENLKKIEGFVDLDSKFLVLDDFLYSNSKFDHFNFYVQQRNKIYEKIFDKICSSLSSTIFNNFTVCQKEKTQHTFEIIMGSYHILLENLNKRNFSDVSVDIFYKILLTSIFKLNDYNLVKFIETAIGNYFTKNSSEYPCWRKYLKRNLADNCHNDFKYEVTLFAFLFPSLYKKINVSISNPQLVYEECKKIRLNNVKCKILKRSNEYSLNIYYNARYYENEDFGEDVLNIKLIVPFDLSKTARLDGFSGFMRNKSKQDLFVAKLNNLLTSSNNYSAILQKLKVYIDKNVEETGECSICHMIICFYDQTIPTEKCYKCMNSFHRRCINMWIKQGKGDENKLCPMCRHPIL